VACLVSRIAAALYVAFGLKEPIQAANCGRETARVSLRSDTEPQTDRRSSSQQQYNQDDEEDCAKAAADIGATIIEAAATEQDQ
jgi:hypothetical protein